MKNTAIKSDIDSLKKDADKVLSDISRLSSTVSTVGKEKSKEFAGEVSKATQEELIALRKKLAQLEDRGREYAVVVDKQVKKNPYMFILGFLGLGLLLGKLLGLKGK